ncbi:MAG: hypothetical protein V3V45_05790 [Candidatus Brocadiales bacterium]
MVKVSRFWAFIFVVTNVFFFLLGFFFGSRFSHAAEYFQGFRSALLVLTLITVAVAGYKLYKKYVE